MKQVIKTIWIVLLPLFLGLSGCTKATLNAPCSNYGAHCTKAPVNSWNYQQ